ncbi:transposase [Nonomuraea angiospora]|uniref:transposase n=1 Tax=Nonomuraea angiospora TaxID=46172 RepID=UPI0037913D0B
MSVGSDAAPSPLASVGIAKHDLCDILYLNRAGNASRYLPRNYPHWQTAYAYFARWQKDGFFDQLTSLLRCSWRTATGRGPDPTTCASPTPNASRPSSRDPPRHDPSHDLPPNRREHPQPSAAPETGTGQD